MLKNILLILLYINTFNFLHAQKILNTTASNQDSLQTEIKKWKLTDADNSVTINQNAFSNWVSGGNNSFSLSSRFKYELTYKKEKNIWRNEMEIRYGQTNNKGDKMKKTDDNAILTSTYGYQILDNWYASSKLIFNTQLLNGYDYDKFPDYSSANRKSAFMTPGYLTAGVGFEYKPEGDFKMTFMPITSKTTLVLDKKLQKKDNFGLKNDGDWRLIELGAYLEFKYKKEIMENITMENSLALFSNYLNHFERVDIIYALLLNLKVNNYISAKFTLDLLYDHDQLQKTQLKETFGAGLSFNLTKK